MWRYDVINHFIKKYNYKSYLEIGVREMKNFNKIKIEDKYCVDPNYVSTFKMTSDKFFESNKKKYDIIFIDGLHQYLQVMRDVENSLKFLNKRGTILLHDCRPKRYEYQVEEHPGGGTWNGTVWKAFAKLRFTRADLYMKTIDTDSGIGIIRRGYQDVIDMKEEDLNYQYYRKRKQWILNLVSVEDFLKEFYAQNK